MATSGFLEQRVVQLDAVRARKAGEGEDVTRRHIPTHFPYVNCVGANTESAPEDGGAFECGDQLVDGGDRLHAPSILHFVRLVKRAFCSMTLWMGADKMLAMVKNARTADTPPTIPPLGEEFAFSRVEFCAARAGKTVTAFGRDLGWDVNSRISQIKRRGQRIPKDMARYLKTKYGVTVDWIEDGDIGGLPVVAREFLGL